MASDSDFSIQEVARLAGTTSRALRHYDEIGLLPPSRVGSNGYRYYDSDRLLRLQRILLLRELGLSLAGIAEVLAGESDDVTALRAHLAWLRQERARLARQIASVEATIANTQEGGTIMAAQMFDGFDHTKYKDEVEQRWGKQAYAQSDSWWRGLDSAGQQGFRDEAKSIGEGWAAARDAGLDFSNPAVVQLAARHVAWIKAGWGGRAPSAAQIIGLAEMYVADERFAANYGGPEPAAYVRDALTTYARAHMQ